MADTNREDMTDHNRDALDADGTAQAPPVQPEQQSDPIQDDRPGQDSPGHVVQDEAPVIPDDVNPQQPAGATPPGGPSPSAGDLLADAQQADAQHRQD